jgi:mannosyl-3-phosphoglycerate phosphatase
MERSGLEREAARLALDREYDEPFVLEDESQEAVVKEAAARLGLFVTRGGRFYHLTGRNDKGFALRRLLTFLRRRGRRFETVALGDAPNDRSMLESVDRPIVVPRPDGSLDPELAEALPAAERAPEPGPKGWNSAVLAVLAGQRLARVADAGGARGAC